MNRIKNKVRYKSKRHLLIDSLENKKKDCSILLEAAPLFSGKSYDKEFEPTNSKCE